MGSPNSLEISFRVSPGTGTTPVSRYRKWLWTSRSMSFTPRPPREAQFTLEDVAPAHGPFRQEEEGPGPAQQPVILAPKEDFAAVDAARLGETGLAAEFDDARRAVAVDEKDPLRPPGFQQVVDVSLQGPGAHVQHGVEEDRPQAREPRPENPHLFLEDAAGHGQDVPHGTAPASRTAWRTASRTSGSVS